MALSTLLRDSVDNERVANKTSGTTLNTASPKHRKNQHTGLVGRGRNGEVTRRFNVITRAAPFSYTLRQCFPLHTYCVPHTRHINYLRCALLTGGDVLIKFHDGAVYDGPYVLEACLSLRGSIPPGERGLVLKRKEDDCSFTQTGHTNTG